LLDISGGSRTLIFGPYIHLPAGPWTARVHFGLSSEAARYPLILDVYSETQQLAVISFQPHTPGIHIVDLHFVLGEPSGRGLEVRMTVPVPDAQGQLAFGYVVLNPPSMLHPEAEIEWEHQFRAILDPPG
jgi:hypothetical protein